MTRQTKTILLLWLAWAAFMWVAGCQCKEGRSPWAGDYDVVHTSGQPMAQELYIEAVNKIERRAFSEALSLLQELIAKFPQYRDASKTRRMIGELEKLVANQLPKREPLAEVTKVPLPAMDSADILERLPVMTLALDSASWSLDRDQLFHRLYMNLEVMNACMLELPDDQWAKGQQVVADIEWGETGVVTNVKVRGAENVRFRSCLADRISEKISLPATQGPAIATLNLEVSPISKQRDLSAGDDWVFQGDKKLRGKVVGWPTGGVGSLPFDSLFGKIEKLTPALQSCYASALKKNDRLRGSLELIWTVRSDGSVKMEQTLDQSLQNKKLRTCLATAAATLDAAGESAVAGKIGYVFRFMRVNK